MMQAPTLCAITTLTAGAFPAKGCACKQQLAAKIRERTCVKFCCTFILAPCMCTLTFGVRMATKTAAKKPAAKKPAAKKVAAKKPAAKKPAAKKPAAKKPAAKKAPAKKA